MTAFSTAQLPGGIYAPTTLEELIVWGTACAQHLNPTDSYTEAPNTSRLFRAIQPMVRTPDADLILINRTVIVVDESKSQSLPIWKRVKIISDTIIPDGFKITG